MAVRDSTLNSSGLTGAEHKVEIGCVKMDKYFSGTYKAGMHYWYYYYVLVVQLMNLTIEETL